MHPDDDKLLRQRDLQRVLDMLDDLRLWLTGVSVALLCLLIALLMRLV